MKHLIITICLCLIAPVLSSGQGEWEVLNEGIVYEFWCVDFINPDTGWIAGGNGLFKTTDGAESWVQVNEDIIFENLDFYNDTLGWATGELVDSLSGNHKRYVFKTYDGGKTWFEQRTVGFFGVGDLKVVSDRIVYIIEHEAIIRTNNGGITWTDVTPVRDVSYEHICSRDMDLVIVTDGEKFYRHLNNGTTWEVVNTEFIRIWNIKFIDDTTGYFIASGDSSIAIYKTTDAFKTWTLIADTIGNLRSCHFFNSDTIIATVSTGAYSLFINIIKSTDGGESWMQTDYSEISKDASIYGGWMYAVNDKVYFFSSAYGMSFIMQSDDLGNHWTCLYIVTDMQDIFFPDARKGFIIGGFPGWHCSGGNLLETSDGGISWQLNMNTNSGIGNLHFFNELNGAINGVGWRFLTTSDKGESWVQNKYLYGENYCSLNDTISWMLGKVINVDIIDDDSIYVLKTNDGGSSWDTLYKFGRNYNYNPDWPLHLTSMFFPSENRGFIVGEGGMILRYSDQQELKRIESGTTLPLFKVFFVDEYVGFISGGFKSYDGNEMYPLLLKTEDGGETWKEIPDLKYLIDDFWFENRNHGWAIGSDTIKEGFLIESFDGGETWEVINDSLPAGLNALHFSHGAGWAVGRNSLILKTEYTYTPPIKKSINRFMVVSDFHHYSPSQDLKNSLLYEYAVAATEEGVDFLFIPGDLVVRQSMDTTAWDSINSDWRWMMDTLNYHNIRLYACRGNNDVGSGAAWDSLFSGIYQFPQNGPAGEENHTYAIIYDNLLFVALDQYTDYGKINQSWLDELLLAYPREHIFAAGHEQAFKVSDSYGMSSYPEARDLLWESLTNAGTKAWFDGHSHFYDHVVMDDGDGDQGNDVRQVIVGTGSYFHSDRGYDGNNGRWLPRRQFHEETNGYVLVELSGEKAKMTWKHRTGPGEFEFGGDSTSFTSFLTGEQDVQINTVSLSNYPNPFRDETAIRYSQLATGYVELSVYGMLGRKVTTLVSKNQSSGKYEVIWNTKGIDPGIYFCELKSGGMREVIMLTVIE